MSDADVDVFQETLKELITSSNLSLIIEEKHQLQSLEEEIKYLRGFLKDTEKKRNDHPEVMKLVMQIRDLVSEAENIVELFVVHAFNADHAPYSHLEHDDHLESVKRGIKILAAEVDKIFQEKFFSIKGVEVEQLKQKKKNKTKVKQLKRSASGSGGSSRGSHTSKVVKGKVVVCFEEEIEKLIEKLDGGKGKPLEIVSIMGAGGGGKTTLAREVYNHPFTSTFGICAWIEISQDYNKTMKRDLLIHILESAIPKKHEDYEKHSDDELGVDVFKYLTGRKYLIVMDNVWGIEAWNDIQPSLPKECMGSKVLFTSRLLIQLDSISYVPHYLALLPSWCWELLQNKGTLTELIMSSGLDYFHTSSKHLQSLKDEVKYLRKFLKRMENTRYYDAKVMRLAMQLTENTRYNTCYYDAKVMRLEMHIKDLVAEAENIVVPAFKADHVPCYLFEHRDHLSLDLKSIKKKMKTLTAKVKNIYNENMYDINGVAVTQLKHSSTESGGVSGSSKGSHTSKIEKEKVVVGFEEEAERLIEKLDDGGNGRLLEIISIIGAAGSGKTTLANKVYDHPFTSHTFVIRAWIDISQDYHKTKKRNLLIRILESVIPRNYDDISDDKLGEDVLKCLKGKKYLIVMDDIWDIEAWNDIKKSFPKECNGSKVLFTSRLLLQLDGVRYVPHYLNPLPTNCCWEMLHKTVFGTKCCPSELVEISKKIAEKCKGLPLAVVTIAGILATQERTFDMWEKVSKHLSSIIAKNQEDCMEILELSYNHLPLHLKACFLYIGGYPEDKEIPIRELIWLWIAEGFIHQSEGVESLEIIAEGYLIDLINRSLVQVARKSPLGGIKACRIHDLLRELCLKKAKDDNFLVKVYEDDSISPSTTNKHRRLSVDHKIFQKFSCHKFFQKFSLRPRNLRSFMCLTLVERDPSMVGKDLAFFVRNFKLLRVLNFLSGSCYGEIGIGHLVHLRYLAFESYGDRAPPFSYLLNLETLNLKSTEKVIELPRDIFKMVKLRHIYTKKGVFGFHLSCGEEGSIGFDRSSKLDSLQTLHQICSCKDCRSFLVRTPNLRKLGLHGWDKNVLRFPELECLKCLETLTFTVPLSYCWYFKRTLPPVSKLPLTITRITLKSVGLKWEELSLLQTLPSLEVLRLIEFACSGPVWNASELDGFPQLKYLKFYYLNIKEWIASEDQFPKLEVLVLERCYRLERIPNDFGNLNELCEIKLDTCRRSVEESAREIQEEQRNRKGDDDCLNLYIYRRYLWDMMESNP